MASMAAVGTAAFLLALNLGLFTLVSSIPLISPKATCPKDALKLGVCANLLNDLVRGVIGTPPKTPCCTLIENLVDFEAAVCLCTVVKANVLGIKLQVPVSMSILVNYCGREVPSGFQCA